MTSLVKKTSRPNTIRALAGFVVYVYCWVHFSTAAAFGKCMSIQLIQIGIRPTSTSFHFIRESFSHFSYHAVIVLRYYYYYYTSLPLPPLPVSTTTITATITSLRTTITILYYRVGLSLIIGLYALAKTNDRPALNVIHDIDVAKRPCDCYTVFGSVLAKYNWKTIFCGHYRSTNHRDVIGLQSYRIR